MTKESGNQSGVPQPKKPWWLKAVDDISEKLIDESINDHLLTPLKIASSAVPDFSSESLLDEAAPARIDRFELVGLDPTLKNGHTSKFWEISEANGVVTTRFGKIGANGQVTTRNFSNSSEASAFMKKKIQEKIREGYVSVDKQLGGNSHSKPAAAEPVQNEEILPQDFGLFLVTGWQSIMYSLEVRAENPDAAQDIAMQSDMEEINTHWEYDVKLIMPPPGQIYCLGCSAFNSNSIKFCPECGSPASMSISHGE